MRALTYYIGTSLDGFAAGPGDEIDFYPLSEDHVRHMAEHYPEVIPTHLREQLGIEGANRRFDTVVQGRRTYQPALALGITSPYAHLRQYVASTTLDPVEDPAVTVVDDALATVRALKQEDGLEIWLAGGGTLAGSVADEIDHLVVKVYPVLAGAGMPVFSSDFSPRLFALTDQVSFDSGAVVLSYDRLR